MVFPTFDSEKAFDNIIADMSSQSICEMGYNLRNCIL